MIDTSALWLGMIAGDVIRWAIGLFIALYGGHVASRSAMWWHWEREKQKRRSWWIVFWIGHIDPPVSVSGQQSLVPAVSSSLVGSTERLFFALVTALSQIGFAAGSMMVWLAIKTALNWEGRRKMIEEDEEGQIRLAQGSAYGSLVSFLFAALGGLVCSGEICLWLCD